MSTPTSTEQRLRDSLDRAASAVDVDPHALYAATRARLDEAPPAAPRRGWVPVVVAAAAAVLVVAAGVVAVDRATEGTRDLVMDRGEVADDFTCPVQRTTTFGPGNDDDSFLPELSSTLQPRGEAAVTKNWEVDRTGNGAVLRLGNADGSLASVTTFDERGDSYEAVSVTKCVNDATPGSSRSAPLIAEDLPRDSGGFTADDLAPGAVTVVDRLTYDTAGLARRYTIWAEPCGPRLCVIAGSPADYSRATLRGDARVPSDRSDQLADPDDVVGQDLGLTLVALYDRPGDVHGLSWLDDTGKETWVDPVTGGGWQGNLFVFLAPNDELDLTLVHPERGTGRTYRTGELTN